MRIGFEEEGNSRERSGRVIPLRPKAGQSITLANGMQVFLVAGQEQFSELRQAFDEMKGKCLFGLAERKFLKLLHMAEPADVVQLVKRDVEATDCLEVAQEIEILARPPVHVKLDIGPLGDQAGSLLQLITRQRPVELNDRAIRLQWPERVYQRLIGGKEATPVDRCGPDGFTHVYRR
jgi:hypothetical protein